MEQTFWRQLVTDVGFAPDGSMLVSDWVNGWEGLGKGRIYRYSNPQAHNDMLVNELQQLLSGKIADLKNSRLKELLGFPDQRVRTEVQFELVNRNEYSLLEKTALDSEKSTLARIHALWE